MFDGYSSVFDQWYDAGNDENIGVGNFFEQIINSLYVQVLHPGDVAIDCGANRGRHTFPMAQAVGESGLVIGIEAIESLSTALVRQSRTLKLPQISIIPMAVGAAEGVTRFVHIRDENGFSGRMQKLDIPAVALSSMEELEVSMTTLDTVFAKSGVEKVRFIKLDLEGGEFDALQGASSTLDDRNGPLLVFEHDSRMLRLYGHSMEEWFGFFESRNYRLYDLFGRHFDRQMWNREKIPWCIIAAKRPGDRKLVEQQLPDMIAGLYEGLTFSQSASTSVNTSGASQPAFVMPTPVLGPGNDYRHILERASLFAASGKSYTQTVSVIIPVYNRRQLLANTLAALTHQTYPQELTEIVVVDDGSEDDVLEVIKKYQDKLNLRYVWQPDKGFRISAARNLGIRSTSGEALVFMDADVIPPPHALESYLRVLHVADDAVLLGHVRFIEVSGITDDGILADISTVLDLPDIVPDNDTFDKSLCMSEDGRLLDWRFPNYAKSDYLLHSQWPFHFLTGWTFAMSRTLCKQIGNFDESFMEWGFEESELGYRAYNAGAYFVPMLDIEGLHQEPLEKPKPAGQSENTESYRSKGKKATQVLFASKCPVPNVRKYLGDTPVEVPKVSIIIHAHNAETHIVEAVQSCLEQDCRDLEVCICDNGSTDNTLALLVKHFRRDKRVRWVSQPQSSVGKASNTALGLCLGMYIGQLESDDLLKPTAVSACTAILDEYPVDGVYTNYEYINAAGKHYEDGLSEAVYDRSQLLTRNICTPFRLLRRQTLLRAGGFSEDLSGEEDFDLWQRVSERAYLHHLPENLYSRRWHEAHQETSEQAHRQVVERGLQRLGLDAFWSVQPGSRLEQKAVQQPVLPEEIFILVPVNSGWLQTATGAAARQHLQAMIEVGLRYLFVVGEPETLYMQVREDVLQVPCMDNEADEATVCLKLALASLFLYRNIRFTYMLRLEQDSLPQISPLLRHIYCDKLGKPFSGIVGGYFIRRDILPLLFNSVDYSPDSNNFPYTNEKGLMAQITRYCEHG